jgi:LCP family protein required for cell wall assembly
VTVVAPPSKAPPSRRGSSRSKRRGRHGLRPVRRWPKRAFIALGSLVLILIMVVVATIVYVNYRLNQVKTASCSTCVAAAAGQPFTVLLIGSDSRQFVDDPSQASQFGSAQSQGGQRSDVTIVARVVPATHQVLLMSIPRDLWVNIPGNVPDISGMNRINAAFNNGPSLLVQTIEDDLGVPINDFAEINFPGLEGMVNSLGGIYLDFPMPVKDAFSGLDITKPGCQLVSGAQALALVRSRHLYYFDNGTWNADVQSDFSRIQRQDVFFRSMITRSHEKITDPFSINAFLGAVATDITVSKSFKGQLLGLAESFHSIGVNALKTETLPTTEFTTSGGADVLQAAQPYANSMIAQFKAFGTTPARKSGSTATSTPSSAVPASSIHVDVLNGDGTSGLAATVSGDLHRAGYTVTGTGNGSSFSFTTSQIQYAPGHLAEAQQLAASISSGTQSVSDPSLTGNSLILTVGSTFAGLQAPSSAGTTTSTTPTTQPPPPNVVTNTQTEPWNPTVCTG